MTDSSIRCLVTAGPTREYFDPVRFITNPSTGKMGYALAEAALEAGWNIDLVSGPVCLPEPVHPRLTFYPVETGEEMFHQVDALFDPCDVLIMTAAVMDFRPAEYLEQKLKKTGKSIAVQMEPVIDILRTVAARKTTQLVVGFAAETNDVEENAARKLEAKNCDFMVANRVDRSGTGFGSDLNRVLLLGKDGAHEEYGPDSKVNLARVLVDRFVQNLEPRVS